MKHEIKTSTQTQGAQDNAPAPIPAEVLKGLSQPAAERLQRFVDSSENFQSWVYGEDAKRR